MSAPVAGMNCSNCLYFELLDERSGECRRYAPHPNASFYVSKMESVGKINTDIHWPKVYNNSWCGQFAANKKTRKPTAPPKKKCFIRPPEKPPEGEEILKLKPEEPAQIDKRPPKVTTE